MYKELIDTNIVNEYALKLDIENLKKVLNTNNKLDMNENYPNLFYISLPTDVIENKYTEIMEILDEINKYYVKTHQAYKYIKRDNLSQIECLDIFHPTLSNEIKASLTYNQKYEDDFLYRLVRTYIKKKEEPYLNKINNLLDNGVFFDNNLFLSLVMETFNQVQSKKVKDAQDILLNCCHRYNQYYNNNINNDNVLNKKFNIIKTPTYINLLSQNIYNIEFIDFVINIGEVTQKEIPNPNFLSKTIFNKNNTINIYEYIVELYNQPNIIESIKEKNRLLNLFKDNADNNDLTKKEKKSFKL